MALTAHQLATADARRDRLLRLGRAFPEVDVDPAGRGHEAFRVRTKAFAYRAVDHHGDGRIALWVKSTRVAQARAVHDDPVHAFVPAYVGAQGWLGLRLDLDEVRWDAVAARLRDAYLASAPKALAARVLGDGPVTSAPRPDAPARSPRRPRTRRPRR